MGDRLANAPDSRGLPFLVTGLQVTVLVNDYTNTDNPPF